MIYNRFVFFGVILLFSAFIVLPETISASEIVTDTLPGKRTLHRLEIETRPSYVIPNHDFFRGVNKAGKPIDEVLPFFIKYSFQPGPDSYKYKIYRGVYQGIGVARFDFRNSAEVGEPIAFYLFQGARIARLSSRLSLNYEWNFGLSFGWKQHDYMENEYNRVVGSTKNAYINVNLYLSWLLSRHLDLNIGADLSHFSNGNTDFPNGGVNTAGIKLGLAYNFGRKDNYIPKLSDYREDIPEFKRHFNYDLVLFGALRRKGVIIEDVPMALPNLYKVFGFSFSPMYNLGYSFKIGFSVDGYYDGSSNMELADYIPGEPVSLIAPPVKNQLALGLSARAEYVMPYFTVCIGYGANILHGGGDLRATYQVLALKMQLTRSSFLHIGYSLHDFQIPNFLMIGIGYRFNNKYDR